MFTNVDTISAIRATTAAALLLATAVAASIAQAGNAPTVNVETVPARRGSVEDIVQAYGVFGGGGTAVSSVSLPYAARVLRLRVASGQRVAAGDALFDVAPDPAALLAAQQAGGALDLARRDLARMQSLYDAHLATGSQLDAARKTLADAEFALRAQQRVGARHPETVATPTAATVLEILVTQGDQPAAGAPLMRLSRADAAPAETANVNLSVEPGDVARVRAGNAVTLRRLQADSGGATAQGKVVVVGAAVDPQTRLVNVAASVPMPAAGWLTGMAVTADIVTGTAAHWIVPRSAVLQDQQGAYLFQVDPAGKAHRVGVTVAVERGDRYGVDGGLSAAMPVVVAGNYELTDGMGVKLPGAASGSQAE
jgi:RND family efflux transporter MFP subunit